MKVKPTELKFALVCVNEHKEVLSVQGFDTQENAYKQMKTEYNYENEELVDDWKIITHSVISQHYAHIYCADECEYHWTIHNIII